LATVVKQERVSEILLVQIVEYPAKSSADVKKYVHMIRSTNLIRNHLAKDLDWLNNEALKAFLPKFVLETSFQEKSNQMKQVARICTKTSLFLDSMQSNLVTDSAVKRIFHSTINFISYIHNSKL